MATAQGGSRPVQTQEVGPGGQAHGPAGGTCQWLTLVGQRFTRGRLRRLRHLVHRKNALPGVVERDNGGSVDSRVTAEKGLAHSEVVGEGIAFLTEAMARTSSPKPASGTSRRVYKMKSLMICSNTVQGASKSHTARIAPTAKLYSLSSTTLLWTEGCVLSDLQAEASSLQSGRTVDWPGSGRSREEMRSPPRGTPRSQQLGRGRECPRHPADHADHADPGRPPPRCFSH
ncbi:hypothetical protein H920_02506 [Fukomys damarensis]|uniref:Uncharacterized protein n=1 Tax=Fukomys damarensis TaxID=885580 RepID=A0A091DYH9_FUKDA|nr:hypothetical protein H920_02506 [Fukomys damarensis]